MFCHLLVYITWHEMILYLYRILATHNKYVRLGFTVLCLWTLYICILRPSRPSQKDLSQAYRKPADRGPEGLHQVPGQLLFLSFVHGRLIRV